MIDLINYIGKFLYIGNFRYIEMYIKNYSRLIIIVKNIHLIKRTDNKLFG